MTGSGESGMSRSARLHGAAAEPLAALGETIEPLEGDLRDPRLPAAAFSHGRRGVRG
jgi:hypothetical protein